MAAKRSGGGRSPKRARSAIKRIVKGVKKRVRRKAVAQKRKTIRTGPKKR